MTAPTQTPVGVERRIAECQNCGARFNLTTPDRKFCSMDCLYTWRMAQKMKAEMVG